MMEYRTSIQHDPETVYAWVELGPIPTMRNSAGVWQPTPSWHPQAQPSRYPFPTDAAAVRFATNNKAEWAEREVAVTSIGGERIEIGKELCGRLES